MALHRTAAWSALALVIITARVVAQSQPPGPTRTPAAQVTVSQPRDTGEPDGDDDPEDTGTGAIPSALRLERIGRAPLALSRICDLTPFRSGLYAAHARMPLGSDGATITRYTPTDARPFSVAFDWNRPGQPRAGGGGGQGFVRVHAIGGRLFVPDADPPYAGFGFAFPGTEGYVFVSDRDGMFALPRGARMLPPGRPDATARAGAAVLPRAYHVLDVIRYRGRYYAATGSVPPGQRAWVGASPGALHAADASLGTWTYEVDYPHPWQPGVWRLGYMVRFRARLYMGIQDYDGREPNDYIWALPPSGADAVVRLDMHPQRVTLHGGALTLRWYADRGRLYWIAYERQARTVSLRVTEDGDRWEYVSLPEGAGVPTDITRFRDGVVVLTSRGLWRVDGSVPTKLADVPRDGRDRGPFDVNDIFCAAPMAVFQNTLYAGGQRDGALYRFVE